MEPEDEIMENFNEIKNLSKKISILELEQREDADRLWEAIEQLRNRINALELESRGI